MFKPLVLALIGVALLGLGVFLAIEYEIEHPCLKTEEFACTQMFCAWSDNDGCKAWIPVGTTCSRCVERGTRETLTKNK